MWAAAGGDASKQRVAAQKIAEAQAGEMELDLTGLGLRAVPPEVLELRHLKGLWLNSNPLTAVPKELGELKALTVLNLSHNQLTAVTKELGGLTALRVLNLSNNRLTEVPKELGELKALTVLDLSNNQLTAVPKELGELKALTVLGLSFNQLTAVSKELGELKALKELRLYNNQLTAVPRELGDLKALTLLGLSRNQLIAVPKELGNLKALSELGLSENQLTTVPKELGHLKALEELFLYTNQLTAVPKELVELKSLTHLFLHDNPALGLPPEVLGPTFDEVFRRKKAPAKPADILAYYFALREAEEAVRRVDDARPMRGVEVVNRTSGTKSQPPKDAPTTTPFTAAPPSSSQSRPYGPVLADLHDDSLRNIRLGFAQLRLRRLNECKLLVLGQGKVGKTSLVNRLIRDTFDPDEEKTEGIAREPWRIPTRQEFLDEPAEMGGGGVTLNVWDFGGQEVMHATHQFFLTQRSVYLVVLDARQGEDKGKIQYWLQMVRTYGGDSPVIVVINQCDPPSPGHPTIDLNLNESRLKLDHPSIKAFIKTSCLSGRGIEPLRTLIREQVHAMEHVYNKLPPGWHEAKQELAAAAASRNFVDESVFREIAERRGVKDAGLRRQLLRLLHDLGTVLNYSDEDDPYRLNETHILDPKWVTRGVYRLLNEHELFQAHGRLPRRDVKKYLREADGYSNAGREFVIGMMKKFQLCFDLKVDGHDGVLIPELLTKDEPPLPWGAPGTLAFEYHYDVLPEGVLPRFIVLSHSKHAGGTGGCWRSGVVLEDEGCRVLVRGDTVKGKVYIHVQPLTKQAIPLRRLALRTARVWFDEIHQNLPARAMVPLTDDPGAPPVKYTYLCELERKKGLDYTWPPDGASRDYSVRELLEGIEEYRGRVGGAAKFGDRTDAPW